MLTEEFLKERKHLQFGRCLQVAETSWRRIENKSLLHKDGWPVTGSSSAAGRISNRWSRAAPSQRGTWQRVKYALESLLQVNYSINENPKMIHSAPPRRLFTCRPESPASSLRLPTSTDVFFFTTSAARPGDSQLL